MITDSQTNFLFLADCLPYKKNFWSGFEKVLKEQKINYSFLPNTKDYWAVDFMPIQTAENRFIQFIFNPDYLRNSPKDHKYLSETNTICQAISLPTIKSKLLVDGGNVVRASNKVIMTDKVFDENKNLSRSAVIDELISKLEVEEIIFIPQDEKDKIGHADGMVRFIDDNTVLVNDYKEEIELRDEIHKILKKAKLEIVPFAYNPYKNNNIVDAKGIYINYLQMGNLIILPFFGLDEDEEAFWLIDKAFPEASIITVKSSEIAKGGGVLNCISWNVLKN